MSASDDWSHDVDPMPSMEPSSDLFDGDILGDELIDIYNAAVVGGSDDDTMDELPTLLASAPDGEKEAPNDGLGAFRPSTSFNDLTTLAPAPTSVNNKAPKPVPVVSATSIQGKAADSKKRNNSGSASDAPAPKRKATGGRKNAGGASKPKSKAATKAAKGSATGKQSNSTPNPLTAGGQLAAAASSGNKTQSMKPIVKPQAHPAKGAAVVTPHLTIKTEAPPTDIACRSTGVATPTEADFKSVAQAAVSNLISNIGGKADTNKKPAPVSKETISENVDTSTEHIKALTGSNWVAVCSGDDELSSCGTADKMNNRARRQNLTPDERARQNRDRNREHARNTRLRKKAYVEELKRTLTALVAQRDTTELEKRYAAQRELEQREVRFRVLEEFLKLRGRNELNYARWAAILEDSFSMTLPNTDYREMAANERGQFEQSLSGVAQAMADSTLCSSFLQTLGKGSPSGETICFAYDCDRKNFFMDNCTAVLNWTATTQGAVQQGAPAELAVRGNLSAKFSPASNKLISVEMSFDTGAIISQINHVFNNYHQDEHCEHEDADAAQFAASEADAILDSLQMPHIPTASVPTNVNVVPVSAASITDGENSHSSDESNGDVEDGDKALASRRAVRVRND